LEARSEKREPRTKASAARAAPAAPRASRVAPPAYADKKRQDAEARKARKEADARAKRIADLEARIAQRERDIKELEAAMSAPGFYEDHTAAKPILDKHQTLMWEVGDLMHQWEMLQAETEV
jgi:uncharacterized protein (DUF3084 family)